MNYATLFEQKDVKYRNKDLTVGCILSIIIVSLLLWMAFKNIKIIFILIGSILTGLSITMGIVSLSLGKLNLISVAFAVLFIGLTVDYGIQIVLRILERQNVEKINILHLDHLTIQQK